MFYGFIYIFNKRVLDLFDRFPVKIYKTLFVNYVGEDGFQNSLNFVYITSTIIIVLSFIRVLFQSEMS